MIGKGMTNSILFKEIMKKDFLESQRKIQKSNKNHHQLINKIKGLSTSDPNIDAVTKQIDQ